MKQYDFSLRFRLASADENPQDHIDSLLDAGCDDATFGVGRFGSITLLFSRDANSAEAAISSAVSDVLLAIPSATLVDLGPDLVSITEIANLLGCTRQNALKYVSGEIKGVSARFPDAAVEGNPSLWHLCEVGEWFNKYTSYQFSPEAIEVSVVAAEKNLLSKMYCAGSTPACNWRELLRWVKPRNIVESGGRFFDPRLFSEAVSILSGDGIGKTKLNKELFYADFSHFRRYGHSITGTSYAAIQLGPVPDGYDGLYAALQKICKISIVQEKNGPYISDTIKSSREKITGLSREEVDTLERVSKFFQKYTAARIIDVSHMEDAWRQTTHGNIIAYEYATCLKTDPLQ